MDEWVPFGTIVKPHGIRGELKVFCESDETALLKKLSKLRIKSKGETSIHALKQFKFAGGLLIVSLDGIDDRNRAEALRQAELQALSAELPTLNDDEYWLYELRGARAHDPAGKPLGQVIRVVTNSMQLLIELKTTHGVELIPFVDVFIVGFDRENQILTLDPPPGLLK